MIGSLPFCFIWQILNTLRYQALIYFRPRVPCLEAMDGELSSGSALIRDYQSREKLRDVFSTRIEEDDGSVDAGAHVHLALGPKVRSTSQAWVFSVQKGSWQAHRRQRGCMVGLKYLGRSQEEMRVILPSDSNTANGTRERVSQKMGEKRDFRIFVPF